MCFSATASFTAGTVLIAAGVLTLRHVRSRSVLPFASIPLFFGIQQIVEGIVWVSFDKPLIHAIAAYIFVFFAYIFWPTFVPSTIWLIEKDPIRKKIIGVIAGLGVLVSVYLFTLSVVGPVTCNIAKNSIAYDVPVPFPLVSFFLYFLTTCMGSMVSSSFKIRVFGTAMLVGFFVAHSFYPETLFSVWCFFSAILSLIIYVHIRDLRMLLGGKTQP